MKMRSAGRFGAMTTLMLLLAVPAAGTVGGAGTAITGSARGRPWTGTCWS
jgi:hypothetical protein